MEYAIQKDQTAVPLLFFMLDSTDHLTGKTGLSPTVTISKAGGSYNAPSGAVAEIANGLYKVAANATDANTMGPLALHATAAGADDCDCIFLVVGYDPYGSGWVADTVANWQRHARLTHLVAGTVWYVAPAASGGNDANDGLTPWSPKLTSKTAIEAATAGDLVILSAGTFSNTTYTTVPTGVVVRGQGMDTTTVSNTTDTGGAIRLAGTGTIEDLTAINSVAGAETYAGSALSLVAGATGIVRRCRLHGDSDVLYLSGGASLKIFDSLLDGLWDGIYNFGSAAVELYNCHMKIWTDGAATAVAVTGGSVRWMGGSIDMKYTGASSGHYTTALFAQGASASLVAQGLKIRTYNTVGSSMHAVQMTGALLTLVGCDYDRTKTSGTILDTPAHSLDANGAALALAGGTKGTDAIYDGVAATLIAAEERFQVIVTRAALSAAPELSVEVDRNYAWTKAFPAETVQTGKSHKLSVYAKRGDATALWSLADANRTIAADGLTVSFSGTGANVATSGTFYYELANVTDDVLICAGPFEVVNRSDTKTTT